MKKIILFLFVFISTTYIGATSLVYVEPYMNYQNNTKYIRIINTSNSYLQCWIQSNDRRYYTAFAVYAGGYSEWYIEPYGPYRWGCN